MAPRVLCLLLAACAAAPARMPDCRALVSELSGKSNVIYKAEERGMKIDKSSPDAGVRVLLETSDGHDTWGTVGVSENLIEASWQALVDSITYKLKKEYG
jgi:hypothetical protein